MPACVASGDVVIPVIYTQSYHLLIIIHPESPTEIIVVAAFTVSTGIRWWLFYVCTYPGIHNFSTVSINHQDPQNDYTLGCMQVIICLGGAIHSEIMGME